ncbi:ribonuclease III [Thiomonas bhubaneswarensis]|uniref:Ribonuclease 3 n=1 Tax=Thiomonas bhubaneswarensis TaxID=339866 RepID=A0A0K6I3K8_9BURK|nr:ribonuclease III [Thiomonas bhubaneswarensis]CUA97720.1 RNAse III [Thiomonas bhubaneswarensis]
MGTTLEKRLGYAFQDRKLFERALTHRSFGADHNERLEFLGDSVLNLSAAAWLYNQAARQDEGQLSRLRAALVRAETLAEVARRVELGKFLRLGEGELQSGGAQRESILADALEALLGAIYLEAGFDAAQAVMQRLFAPLLESLDADVVRKDAKTQLQEFLQGQRLPLPSYAVLDVRGAAHQQQFKVECVVAALGLKVEGEGDSRRRAEQDAAMRMIERIGRGGTRPQRGSNRPVLVDERAQPTEGLETPGAANAPDQAHNRRHPAARRPSKPSRLP